MKRATNQENLANGEIYMAFLHSRRVFVLTTSITKVELKLFWEESISCNQTEFLYCYAGS